MKLPKYFIAGMAMGIPPWGLMAGPLGFAVQSVALGIQIVGLALIIAYVISMLRATKRLKQEIRDRYGSRPL